eukprot:GHVT01091675.1.p1 GENE.GHVT01091675.1~~GHVT01091675.1.p1  ORF type:complete len:172 (+),score=34.29 GHVT01091675.1:2885-3400(+)
MLRVMSDLLASTGIPLTDLILFLEDSINQNSDLLNLAFNIDESTNDKETDDKTMSVSCSGSPLAACSDQAVRDAPQYEVAGGSPVFPCAVADAEKSKPSKDKGQNLKQRLLVFFAAAVVPTAVFALMHAPGPGRSRKNGITRHTKASDSDQKDMLPLSGNSNVESHFGRYP